MCLILRKKSMDEHTQMLKIAEKDFKAATLTMFKGLKETMFKSTEV